MFMYKRPEERVADKKRINDTINQFIAARSKCCDARVKYTMVSGCNLPVRVCSECKERIDPPFDLVQIEVEQIEKEILKEK